MKTQLLLLTLLSGLGLGGCVKVLSNKESGNLPPFQNILVVAKQKTHAQRYADSYRFAFPAGYQITTLGIDELTFGNPDSLIRQAVAQQGCEVVLWLETRPSGTVSGDQNSTSSDFELYGELRSWPTNRPFWKMRASMHSVYLQISPARVVSTLQRDGILNEPR